VRACGDSLLTHAAALVCMPVCVSLSLCVCLQGQNASNLAPGGGAPGQNPADKAKADKVRDVVLAGVLVCVLD
jgi:hypothetical protein